eukprot:scaffold36730_cov18-Tisochrysis_lutea.AAC.1
MLSIWNRAGWCLCGPGWLGSCQLGHERVPAGLQASSLPASELYSALSAKQPSQPGTRTPALHISAPQPTRCVPGIHGRVLSSLTLPSPRGLFSATQIQQQLSLGAAPVPAQQQQQHQHQHQPGPQRVVAIHTCYGQASSYVQSLVSALLEEANLQIAVIHCTLPCLLHFLLPSLEGLSIASAPGYCGAMPSTLRVLHWQTPQRSCLANPQMHSLQTAKEVVTYQHR